MAILVFAKRVIIKLLSVRYRASSEKNLYLLMQGAQSETHLNNLYYAMRGGAIKSAFYNKIAKYGSWIGSRAKISQWPTFPHGLYGIFISDGTEIGENCVIFQQVTIGSNTLIDSKRFGSPHIGNNCYIGAGAKIIGNVKIGNNCRIGAGTVVVIDIPDNSVVVQSNTRVIHKENMDNKFYNMDSDGKWGYFQDGKRVVIDNL